MFKPFTMEDIKEYAKKMGYAEEDIEIEEYDDYNYETGETKKWYDVSFGREWTETWTWYFCESLEGYAEDYFHEIVED